MKNLLVLLGCVVFLLCVSGCQKGPKQIDFNGKTYLRKGKHRAMAFTILTYLQKGENALDAKEFVNFFQTESGGIAKERSMKRIRMMVKRYDKEYKSYNKNTQFCYRQRHRGKRILIFSTFDMKHSDLRMFQYGKRMTKEQQQEDIEVLCEKASTYLDDLVRISGKF